MQRRMIRTIGGVLAAGLAVVLSASPALAVDWGPDVKLSSTTTSDHELVRTGPNSAISVWVRTSTLIARRTTDGGRTWLPSQTLATRVTQGMGVSAVGQNVDVVYTVPAACPTTGDFVSRIFYRRSTAGGATWSTPRAITSACSQVAEPDVARSADGQVSIAWTGLRTGRILVATSRDGGATFGPPVHAATTSVRNFDTIGGGGGGTCCFFGGPALAIGSGGTTYLAYTSAAAKFSTLSVRRSLNRGATWSAPTRLTATAVGPPSSLVAAGDRALVGYTVDAAIFRAVYRTTANRGTTWSSQLSVVSIANHQFSHEPEFAIDGGVLGVIVKFGTPGASPVWYRQSTNWGSTWSSTIRISPPAKTGLDPETAGLVLLADNVLAGHAENGGTEGLWIRQGTR